MTYRLPQRYYIYIFMGILFFSTSCAYHPKKIVIHIPEKEEIAPKEEAPREAVLRKEYMQEKEVPFTTPFVIPHPLERGADFALGEKLTYAVDWLGIHCGNLTLEVSPATLDGRQCYRILAKTEISRVFALFYNVTYALETYIDRENNLPLKFHKLRIKSRKETEETIRFEHNTNTAIWEYSGSEPKKVELKKDTQDILSSLYYLRLYDIQPHHEYAIDILFNGRVWPMKIKTEEAVYLDFRRGSLVKAIVARPISELSQEITRKENVRFYLSADKSHTPLLFKVHTWLGTFTGVIKQ